MAGRRLVKQLTCPRCGEVVAEAAYRRFPPSLRLTGSDGAPVQPVSGALLLRIVEQRLAEAPDAERTEARNALEFVRRHLGELMYDLTCRRGHLTVQTVPGTVRAMRRTPGRWVSPR